MRRGRSARQGARGRVALSRLRQIGLLVLVNVAILLALELVAWGVLTYFVHDDAKTQDGDWLNCAQMSFEDGLYQWDDRCLWRLKPGYRSLPDPGRKFWGTEPLALNNHGMRGPDVTLAKLEGVRRVMILGGSHPMGMYVNYDESYAAVLERRLNESTPHRWQVLNAAAPGHTSFQGRQFLEFHGVEFSPDIVISDLGVNDLLPLSREFPLPDHLVTRPPEWAVKTRSKLRISAVYRLVAHLLSPSLPDASKGGPTQRVPPSNHLQNLRDMKALGEAKGFRTLFVSQAMIDQRTGFATCHFPEREMMPEVADVCGLWAPYGSRAADYFVDTMHASPEGHALIAGRLYESLDRLGWLR